MIVSQLKKDTLAEARDSSWSLADSIEFLPIGRWVLSHDSLIELLVAWRTEQRDNFFFNTIPTIESMKKYLLDYSIGDPTRILFLIKKDDVVVGHIGFSNITPRSAELDQVMKSFNHNEELPKEFMEVCLEAMISWGRRNLKLEKVSLEVVSTNTRAIKLYLKCGFEFVSGHVCEPECSNPWELPNSYCETGHRFKVRMLRTLAPTD